MSDTSTGIVATARASLLLLLLPFAAGAEPATNRFQPLAFLAGSCWKGTLPDGKQTDEHCFSWIYGGKFLRDVHVVRGNGPDHTGESIYYWDDVAKQLEYLYIESDGGHSQGSVSATGNTLVFPPTSYVEDGKTVAYRSQWVHATADSYEVVTEFQGKTSWVPGFKSHMQRVEKP